MEVQTKLPKFEVYTVQIKAGSKLHSFSLESSEGLGQVLKQAWKAVLSLVRKYQQALISKGPKVSARGKSKDRSLKKENVLRLNWIKVKFGQSVLQKQFEQGSNVLALSGTAASTLLSVSSVVLQRVA